MNDLADKARAEVADLLDLQLSPLGLRAIEAVSPRIGDTVLDVGCGAGQSVLQLADRVGTDGRVTGVDIAPLALQVARRRAAGRSNVRFIECDALRLALPDRSFDCVFSRFGVMAFQDPVATFSNFRRMMRPSGRLAFVSQYVSRHFYCSTFSSSVTVLLMTRGLQIGFPNIRCSISSLISLIATRFFFTFLDSGQVGLDKSSKIETVFPSARKILSLSDFS